MFEALSRRWTWVHSKLALAAFATFLAASPVPAPDSGRVAAIASTPQLAPAPAPASSFEPAGSVPMVRKAALPEPNTGLVVNGVLALERPLEPSEYAWNPEGVPQGRTIVVVDLDAQVLYVYRAGVEIGRTTLIAGDEEKPTPLGTFPILQKRVHHVSNLYDALMPYMLRLTWDGIAIHGSVVGEGNVTHGCIGIPEEFAQLLFESVKVGDRVLVTRNWSPVPAQPAATA
jgi:lipoprotein-anchoring transpeptidase ErfK/SrfK